MHWHHGSVPLWVSTPVVVLWYTLASWVNITECSWGMHWHHRSVPLWGSWGIHCGGPGVCIGIMGLYPCVGPWVCIGIMGHHVEVLGYVLAFKGKYRLHASTSVCRLLSTGSHLIAWTQRPTLKDGMWLPKRDQKQVTCS